MFVSVTRYTCSPSQSNVKFARSQLVSKDLEGNEKSMGQGDWIAALLAHCLCFEAVFDSQPG